jgi:hypothetical protein
MIAGAKKLLVANTEYSTARLQNPRDLFTVDWRFYEER